MSARPSLPLLRAISQATSDSLKADLTAGLTTAIMLVPQAMAYAMLAGLDPIVGLYASILPTAIYALFGTSPVLDAIGLYNLVAGWSLKVDENDALVEATRTVGFPVGHASAQLGWRGWLSRPTWRILLYSNEQQPERRGLVLIDGYDGEVLDTIVEKNPEDWSQYV